MTSRQDARDRSRSGTCRLTQQSSVTGADNSAEANRPDRSRIHPCGMRVAVAGASGLIGTELVRALRGRGDEAVALPRFGTAPWSVEGADAVVNLAGASVAAKRWTPAYKKEIEDSRVLSTRALVDAIRAAKRKPRVLVN